MFTYNVEFHAFLLISLSQFLVESHTFHDESHVHFIVYSRIFLLIQCLCTFHELMLQWI